MFRALVVMVCLGTGSYAMLGACLADETKPTGILFSESFEDAQLAKRAWYDGSTFRIAAGALAGRGCIEYEWTESQPACRAQRRCGICLSRPMKSISASISNCRRGGAGAAGTTTRI